MKNLHKSVSALASHFRARMTETEVRKALALAKQVLWRREPLEYLVERLGVRRETIQWSLLPEYRNHKWDGDVDPLLQVLNAVAQDQWVGVESATGVGKTYIGACLTFWFLECWRDGRIIIQAPKEKQVELHLWREVNMLYPKFGLGTLMTKELRMDPRPKVWAAEVYAAGVSAEEVDASARRAQGFHGKDMLFLLEETPGIHQAVMTAIQNTAGAPHNLIVAFGNPDHQGDTLHQFCKLSRVKSIRISAFDHPNIVLKNPDFIPGAQSLTGLETMFDLYNHNDKHPLYVSRAHGLCPAQSKHALIKWEWCERATRRRAEQAMPGPRALGVDVANSETGDYAAIAEGEGSLLLPVEDFSCKNASELASNRIYPLMIQKSIDGQNVGVDGVGVGASTVNKLLEYGEVVDIQSGAQQVEIPDRAMVERFNNLRSQGWWLLMLDLADPKGNIILPYDKVLFTDLCTPTWETKGGKIVVESKESIRKRLGRSPNKGDACMYWNLVRRGWLEARSAEEEVSFMSL